MNGLPLLEPTLPTSCQEALGKTLMRALQFELRNELLSGEIFETLERPGHHRKLSGNITIRYDRTQPSTIARPSDCGAITGGASRTCFVGHADR